LKLHQSNVFLNEVEAPAAQQMQAIKVQSGVQSPRRFKKSRRDASAFIAEVCMLAKIKTSSRDSDAGVCRQSLFAIVAVDELLVEGGRLPDEICEGLVVLYLAH